MPLSKQQYSIAIGSAKQNAQAIAHAKQLDEKQTRALVLRAVIARQLELVGEAQLLSEGRTEQGVEALSVMSRRREDLIFDFHRKV